MSAIAPGSDNQAVNQDIQQILAEVRALHRRMDTLNTSAGGGFGNPEGEAGDEGRLVVLERRMNNHSGRISKLEGFRWWLLGGLVVADVIILYALALWQAAKAAGK
jgi:hypothetical protein